MRFPNLLLVGAQKSGTTTFWNDLSASPDVWLSPDKELGDLVDPLVLTDRSKQAAYAASFSGSAAVRYVGEASTKYTQDTFAGGAARRARTLLGAGVVVLYIVRDPIERIRSHYRHRWGRHSERRPIGEAVRSSPEYVRNSRYAEQFAPWRDAFGDRCLVLRFDYYAQERRATLDRVATHLGVEPFSARVDVDEVRNASQNRPSIGRTANAFRSSRLYRDFVRPVLPVGIRERLVARALPRAPLPEDDRLSPPDVEWILEQLADDLERQADVLRIDTWSKDALVARHASPDD